MSNRLSYLALIERKSGNLHKFFSESPTAIEEAEKWIAINVPRHRMHEVRVSLSKVIWSTSG